MLPPIAYLTLGRIRTGELAIRFEGGTGRSLEEAVQIVDEEPMLSAPIDVFSQIFCGYKPAATLAEHGDVNVWDETALDLCNEIFFDQPTFTQDWF